MAASLFRRAVALRRPASAPLRRTLSTAASHDTAPGDAPSVGVVPPPVTDKSKAWMEPVALNPRQVVEALSKHIIGQADAKRAIAVALRNRWRRMRLPVDFQDEVIPKNILMVGPTGCGKTEIARRLAKLCRAPFIKVEATKFTEVGFHGRDVDSIIKDLLDVALGLVRELRGAQLRAEVAPIVDARIIEALTGPGAAPDTAESFRALLRGGQLEDTQVTVEVPPAGSAGSGKRGGGGGLDLDLPAGPVSVGGVIAAAEPIDFSDLMQRLSGLTGAGARPKQSLVRRSMRVSDARSALTDFEVDKRLSGLDLRREAVALAEQNGIVFIDEIDKIISNKSKHSGDASAEGVQRDLLPLIEGTTVDVRKFGPVRTDHMLFVASGAFHEHKPSDLLAELQGRLPIRVELKGLDAADLRRILTEPAFNLLAQQAALLAVEGVDLSFAPEAVDEIARLAAEVNRTVENIGARRLHTVIEKVIEDVSYEAADLVAGAGVPAAEGGAATGAIAAAPAAPRLAIVVDVPLVRRKVLPMLERTDLSRFIL